MRYIIIPFIIILYIWWSFIGINGAYRFFKYSNDELTLTIYAWMLIHGTIIGSIIVGGIIFLCCKYW
jgi:hypothetical protein